MQIVNDYSVRQAAAKESVEMLFSKSLYIIKRAQLAGNMIFDGHMSSAEERKNTEECRMLCGNIEHQLRFCKANEIPILLNCYELLYMVGNHSMPERDFTDHYKRHVIDAWMQGDKTIEDSEIFRLIMPDAAYHPETNPEYVTIYRTFKDNWIHTLFKFNHFPNVNTKENYERLALIMRENLDKHFGVDSLKMKRKWYIVNKVDKLSDLSSTILRAYQCFVTALYPDVLTYNEMVALDTIILKELTCRTDLDPYISEAYRLSLLFNTKQVN